MEQKNKFKINIKVATSLCVSLFIVVPTIFFILPKATQADINTGLVAHWAMDDGSGNTVTDSSTNANDSIINGTANWVSGKINGALSFDGSTNFARVATFNNPPASTMSLCGWIKTSATDEMLLSFSRNGSGNNNEGIFQILPSGKIQFWDYSNTYGFPYNGLGSNQTVNDDRWHLVCFVKNGTSGTYYIDGAQSGTTTASVDVTYGNADWVLGADYRDNVEYFNGLMDDVRVYNIALTPTDVASMYGLVGYWKLDDGLGSTTADSSGYNNNGTLLNSPSWTIGKVGDALNFNNASSSVTIPNDLVLNPTAEITVSAWVRTTSTTTSEAFVSKSGGGNSTWLFEANSSYCGNSKFNFSITTAGVGHTVCSTSSFAPNTWYNVAATYDGSSVDIYVNGTLDSTQAITGAIATNTLPVIIGNWNSGTLPWNGDVDDVRIYSRSLLAEEIATLASTVPSKVTGLSGTGTYNTGYSLSWNANPVGESITDYILEYSTDSGSTWSTIDTASTTTSYTLSSYPPGDYLFRVSAVNAVGQGTASNQFEINSPVNSYTLGNACIDLQNIATSSGDDVYGHYTMSSDIDCSDVPNFVPINFNNGFVGSFDGAHHTITNLNISTTTTDYVGLFTQIQNGATIENLNITNATVSSQGNYTGILVGYSNGTIQNVAVSGSSTGIYDVGGLLGLNDLLGVVSSSSARVYVTGDNTANSGGTQNIAGFVGESEGSIDNSYSTGTVTSAAGSSYAYNFGGFVGTSNNGTLSYDYSTASVVINPTSDQNSYNIAGFAGQFNSTVEVDHSYATGDIIDPDDYANQIGGFVGYSQASLSHDHATGNIISNSDDNASMENFGGFVGGSDGYNTIDNSYSTGSIIAAFPDRLYYSGGFSGYNVNPITDSYSTGNVAGEEAIGGFSGYSGGVLSKVYSTGNVAGAGTGPVYIGGLVGYNQGTDIDDAYASGNVSLDSSATGSMVSFGGLVGYNNVANINRTYASGSVLAGDNSTAVGGLIGTDIQNSTAITNSYSVGLVSGGVDVGGLIGLEIVNASSDPNFINLDWYSSSNVSASSTHDAVGDFQSNNGSTDNGPIHNFLGTVYGNDTANIASFYSTSHPVYALNVSGGWDFSTPVWDAHAAVLPTLDGISPHIQDVVSAPIVPQLPNVARTGGSGGGNWMSTGLSTNTIASNQNQSVSVSTQNIVTSNSASSTVPIITKTAYQFKRALRSGMTGVDVKALQEFLNFEGFTLAQTGPGSEGYETTLYSAKTKDAVARFQAAHFKDIITQAGLTAPSGIFGQYTKAFANSLLAHNSWQPK